MVFLTIVTGANLNQLITFGGPTLYSIGLLENRTRYPPMKFQWMKSVFSSHYFPMNGPLKGFPHGVRLALAAMPADSPVNGDIWVDSGLSFVVFCGMKI